MIGIKPAGSASHRSGRKRTHAVLVKRASLARVKQSGMGGGSYRIPTPSVLKLDTVK